MPAECVLHSMEDIEHIEELTPFSVIGQGSYGEVVRCHCKKFCAEVAVKVTRSERAYRLAADKEVVALQLMQGSPHAVQYIRHYEYAGALHIVLELIPRSLHQQLELLKDARESFAKGILGDTRWIEFIRQTTFACCSALAELHSKGFMHMDVKPENVMVRGSSELVGNPVLIDFGSVRRLSDNQYFNVQSLWYRAPEVALQFPYTPKVDSWGVGCLLAELLLGEALFPVHSVDQLLNHMDELIGLPSVRKAYEEVENWERGGRSSTLWQPSFNRSFLHKRVSKETRLATKLTRMCNSEPTLIDLTCQLLHPDPSQRMSCQEALQHPFLHDLTVADPINPPSSFSIKDGLYIISPSEPNREGGISATTNSSSPYNYFDTKFME